MTDEHIHGCEAFTRDETDEMLSVIGFIGLAKANLCVDDCTNCEFQLMEGVCGVDTALIILADITKKYGTFGKNPRECCQ